MKIRLFLIVLISFALQDPAISQTINNLIAKQEGKKIALTYDFVAVGRTQKYTTSLFLSEDGGATWQGPLEKVTGDVNENITPGNGKRIVWDVLSERESFQGESIVFEVRASVMKSNFTETAANIDMEMVYVQGGTFTMGCTTLNGVDCYEEEKPSHAVTLKDFYIGKFEVTQKQWKKVMGTEPSGFKECDNCPVENVSYDDALEFMKKLNTLSGKSYRLPSEAQWEYAARGGKRGLNYKYSGSNSYNEVSWNEGNAAFKTHPVAQKISNELGLFDMSGNVWEWCSDWYGAYSISNQQNPEGIPNGTLRVRRGGGWRSDAKNCRVSHRDKGSAAERNDRIGFRIVLVP